jgi:dTDP-4-amino-4,6-dideoxygalactose transaminase
LIPILVPTSPDVSKTIKYFREIDKNRIYSNFGPLSDLLTERLANHFGVFPSNITLLANATLAIEGAIRTSRSDDILWECPAWTFTATPAAVLNSSKTLKLVDVGLDWRVSPTYEVKNLIDVLPFGSTIDLKRLSTEKLDCLVIDGAASFDSLGKIDFPVNLPTSIIVSMHATKIFPAGEGGIFISNDVEWVKRVKKWSNFGMGESRVSDFLGTNAKLNEYNAAVALATLDIWGDVREQFRLLSEKVIEICDDLNLAFHSPFVDSVAPYWILKDLDVDLKLEIVDIFEANKVSTRDWWSLGCHRMPAYSSALMQANSFVNTDKIAKTSIGLPFHLSLTEKHLDLIHNLIGEAQSRVAIN